MKIEQRSFKGSPDAEALAQMAVIRPGLVLAFASVDRIADPALHARLRAAFGGAALMGCSTAGEISAHGVDDDSVVVTALAFDSPGFRVVSTAFDGLADSQAAGERLGRALSAPDGGAGATPDGSTGAAPGALRGVLVFGQGVDINGSALIAGVMGAVPRGVALSGGLAGDGGAFRQTFILDDQGASSARIVAAGFYGERIRLGHGSYGGWRAFGPARKVTRSQANILYELDGSPALEVYRRYLGDYAKDLPASGLLFPFSMLDDNKAEAGLIRTILGVNEADGSLVLAGDVVQDGYLQLMHASTDALVDGASVAAEAAAESAPAPDGDASPSLALLVSCVGRKLVMGARVEEEVEAVADVLGHASVVTGFYSNGEISPQLPSAGCRLHNQTMTITTLRELPAA